MLLFISVMSEINFIFFNISIYKSFVKPLIEKKRLLFFHILMKWLNSSSKLVDSIFLCQMIFTWRPSVGKVDHRDGNNKDEINKSVDALFDYSDDEGVPETKFEVDKFYYCGLL